MSNQEIAFAIFLSWVLSIAIAFLLVLVYNALSKSLKSDRYIMYREEEECALTIFGFIFAPVLFYFIIDMLLMKKYRLASIDKVDFEMDYDIRSGQNIFWFSQQYVLKTECKHTGYKVGSAKCKKCRYHVGINDIPAYFSHEKRLYIESELNVECCISGKRKNKPTQ